MASSVGSDENVISIVDIIELPWCRIASHTSDSAAPYAAVQHGAVKPEDEPIILNLNKVQ